MAAVPARRLPADRVPRARPLHRRTGTSARSQIGEALLATRGAARAAGRVQAASAGSHPAARVNPYAVEVPRDHDIAWEGRTPKSIDDVAGGLADGERFDLVVISAAASLHPMPGGRGGTKAKLPIIVSGLPTWTAGETAVG